MGFLTSWLGLHTQKTQDNGFFSCLKEVQRQSSMGRAATERYRTQLGAQAPLPMAFIFRVNLIVQDSHWDFSQHSFLQVVLRRTTANSSLAFWKVLVHSVLLLRKRGGRTLEDNTLTCSGWPKRLRSSEAQPLGKGPPLKTCPRRSGRVVVTSPPGFESRLGHVLVIKL